MKSSFYIILLFCLAAGCKQPLPKRHGELPGNNIINWIPNCIDTSGNSRCSDFEDPVDDTVSYKRVSGNVFRDTAGKVYVLTMYQDGKYPGTDTSFFVHYFQDVSEEIDLNTYRVIEDDYFTTKGKVFLWWGDMEHSFPVEVVGADPNSFKPFNKLAGGTDRTHVFYGGPPSSFEIIERADPRTLKILNPQKGCWNCGNCYFTDNANVFFGNHLILGADVRTFKLVNQEAVDAVDKRHKYFDGEVIK